MQLVWKMTNKHECTEKVVAGGITFSMDSGCLLIKVRDEYPMPLTAQATHQLFNLLFINRADIINANVAAKMYGAEKGNRKGTRGPNKKWKTTV